MKVLESTWEPLYSGVMSRKYRGSAVILPNIPHQDLVDLIRYYASISRKGMTAICAEATGDDKLIWDLQGGRRVGADIRKAITDYIQKEMLAHDDHLNELETLLQKAIAA